MALPVSRIVNVNLNLSPTAAIARSFGILMIAGDSNVINGLERFRSYSTYEDVTLDFGITTPEAKAASLYFGQTPKPKSLMIGRWLRTATSGFNLGAILTTSQQAISNFTSITNGGVDFVIDGVAKNLASLNFSAVTNLNGVATVINAALTGGVCTWTGSQFKVTSNSTGAGTKATGNITFTGNTVNGDTLTVDGTLITFVNSSPVGNQVVIGATEADTINNLLTFLQSSLDTNISLATYSLSGTVITVTYKTVGTTGNSFTLAETSASLTVSATLSGGTIASTVSYATTGSGTDISTLLGLTSTTSIALINGFASETPAQCASALASKSSDWYGLMFAASTMPTNQQSLDVSAFIEPLDLKRIYGVTITDTSILSSLVLNDLASLMKALGYLQSFCQYSSTNPYAIASAFGREFAVDFNANKSTITLMFKQEPGVVAEDLTTDQANVLQTKRCNVFVKYVNNTNIIQYAMMSGPAYLDEIHGLDWLQDQIQNDCYNALYTSATKLPQTDQGVNVLTNASGNACDLAVNNGLVAPGVWTADGFGQLSTGQYLKTGYYIYAQPVALQSQADREARKAPPIQIAVKLAGAIQSVDVTINVNR